MLHVSDRTLIRWRAEKVGPPFFKVGKAIRYDRREVEKWLKAGGVENAKK